MCITIEVAACLASGENFLRHIQLADREPQRLILGAQHAQPARLQFLGAGEHRRHAKILVDERL